jgi:hypothetical protein
MRQLSKPRGYLARDVLVSRFKHRRDTTLKRLFGILTTLAIAIFSTSSAQDVRSLGMGGVLLPGSSLAPYNPAYANYPDNQWGRGGGFSLPVGLINFFVRPQMNILSFATNRAPYVNDPQNNPFDLLAIYDQATNLNSFILNPPASPNELIIDISAQNGVRFFDGAGNVLNFSSDVSLVTAGSSSSRPIGVSPIFRLPINIGPVQIGVGVFANLGRPGISINQAFLTALASNSLKPKTTYTFATGTVQASAGVALDLAFATNVVLPSTTVYVGARAVGFYGLGYVSSTVNAQVVTKDDGSVDTSTLGKYDGVVFISSPLYHPGDNGFGVDLDLGVATDFTGAQLGVPEIERVSVGLGVLGGLTTSSWTGQEFVVKDSDSNPFGTGKGVAKTVDSGLTTDPLFTFNAAGLFNVGVPGLRVLGATDLQLGRGAFSVHLGAEAQFGLLVGRAGIGYNNGLTFGLGGGVDFGGGIGLDLALTTHTPIFTSGYTALGIAVALKLGF